MNLSKKSKLVFSFVLIPCPSSKLLETKVLTTTTAVKNGTSAATGKKQNKFGGPSPKAQPPELSGIRWKALFLGLVFSKTDSEITQWGGPCTQGIVKILSNNCERSKLPEAMPLGGAIKRLTKI